MTKPLKPTCWIIAGPNGAGKTTFALEYLSDLAGCENFVNADLIAAGISPLAPEKELLAASKIFLKEIKNYIKQRKDFSFETTIAGKSYLKLIDSLVNGGWNVELIYLALPDVDASIMRVAERVLHGGHNISIDDIKRRFPRGLSNLINLYSKAASRTRCFMNSNEIPELIFETKGENITIYNEAYFNLLFEKVSE